jgi:ketosteroid isomerase-like protein
MNDQRSESPSTVDGPIDDREALVRRLFALVNDRELDAALALCAEDVVFHMPYLHGDESPVTDREQFRKLFVGSLGKSFSSFRFDILAAYPALDPEVIVMEYRSEAEVHPNVRYANRYVGIFRIRDGRIASWREYFDVREVDRAFAEAAAARAKS